jgi:DNA replication protein DnaC
MPGDDLRVEPCECQGDLRRAQRMASANIPKRYSHCTLDTFRDSQPVLRNAKKRVQEFIDLWPTLPDGRPAVHGAAAARGRRISRSRRSSSDHGGKPGRVLFTNFQDLIQEIQASFDSDRAGQAEIMRRFWKPTCSCSTSSDRRSRRRSCRTSSTT